MKLICCEGNGAGISSFNPPSGFFFSICGILPFISMHSVAASRLTTTSGCVGLCLPFFQMTNDKHSLIASDD